jgi:hypothetical protein
MTVVQTPTSSGNHIRWGRVVGLAFALEAALFAALVPIQSLLRLRVWFAAVAIGCALFGYAAGRLAARGLPSRALLHGFLVGLLATIIYIVLCMTGPGGLPAAVAFYGAPLFVAVNALRIAGCAAGAFHSARA